MFSDLPKLFGREFAIGYFLPIAIFIGVSLFLLSAFFPSIDILLLFQRETLLSATVIVVVLWLGSISLLATNRDIIRLLEGYGVYNPAKLFGAFERKRFQKLSLELSQLDRRYVALFQEKREIPQDLITNRNRILRELADNFPDNERWLLPTAFGNTLRAFEVYPRIMYGIDAIPGWSRLLTVIPKDYVGLIDIAKSNVDFWVNFWFLSIIFMVEYIILVLILGLFIYWWCPIIALGIAFISSWRAKNSAVEWGEYIKSAFDVFLPDLQKKIGFSQNIDDDQKVLWTKFSQATVYRNPKHLPRRVEFLHNKGEMKES